VHRYFVVKAQLQVFNGVVFEFIQDAVLDIDNLIHVFAHIVDVSTLEVIGDDAVDEVDFIVSTVFSKGFSP
jgi:hypothetical protein